MSSRKDKIATPLPITTTLITFPCLESRLDSKEFPLHIWWKFHIHMKEIYMFPNISKDPSPSWCKEMVALQKSGIRPGICKCMLQGICMGSWMEFIWMEIKSPELNSCHFEKKPPGRSFPQQCTIWHQSFVLILWDVYITSFHFVLLTFLS